jgi:hypothetical protein
MEQREEAERDVMKELEIKTLDAKTEMQIADALDEIRTRNAHNERTAKEGAEVTMVDKIDNERERQAATMLKQQVWLSWQAGVKRSEDPPKILEKKGLIPLLSLLLLHRVQVFPWIPRPFQPYLQTKEKDGLWRNTGYQEEITRLRHAAYVSSLLTPPRT